jgi:hypothetical protein
MIARNLASRLVALTAACAVIGFAFLFFVRPAYLNWGATAEERAKRLPGDEIVANAASQNTRAITIDGPVEQVWPWIAQVGQDRGGFYSFDLLENLVGCEMPTTDTLMAEKQAWQVGDKLWMYPPDKAGGSGFATLRTLDTGRALGFGTRLIGTSLDQEENGSWTFAIEPADLNQTRLLIRGRGVARTSFFGVAFDQGVFEPIHFAMERRMMIGLAQLVETGRRDRIWNHIQPALWMMTFLLFVAAAVFVVIDRRWIRSLAAFLAAAVVFQVLTLMQPPLALSALLVVAVFLLLHGPPTGSAKTATPAEVRSIS